ncbi:nicotinamide-nucleotide amidase [Sporomusaceae bacterium BoRhaA]|uniref:competence/damage-inducible protein A n=1 Tax=Pelorhabdus rhamnosifermentans TaxID=2772457 RepID=UPI001C0621FE|nr:competence/damage-inducible protein A [Pelorhabdus rhamnosifermentans]MBU2701927.1 nicotinamide-nucleotide amidase [Pelorhabdus rhamnosifermentans]
MIVELVSTGTELLLGQIVNTNAVFLAQHLNEMGFDVLYQTTVGDNRNRMTQVLETALARADIVITTGGLGPTQGDITKEVTAKLLNLPLVLHEPSLERIHKFFQCRQIPMADNNKRQAFVAQGAIILDNERGTAPGTIVDVNGKIVIHLPGPPSECEHMFTRSVVPYLQKNFGQQGIIVSKILRTYGLGESSLEEAIKDYILAQSNPTIALLVRSGEVIIRLTAKAASREQAETLIAGLEKLIRERVGDYIFGINQDTLEEILGQHLTEKELTVALAESCTGGLVTSRLTDVPGSSVYLKGSIVSYSNEVKMNAIHVEKAVLEKYGAVSEETACQMAQGARNSFKTSLGVGITGIAGPGGATETKPVGLVFIAVDGPLGTKCYEYHFVGQRKEIKNRTALAALNQLRRYVLTL